MSNEDQQAENLGVGPADFYRAVFGGCANHRHEQVGMCVYCADCGRRLYQGSVLSEAELRAVRELVEG